MWRRLLRIARGLIGIGCHRRTTFAVQSRRILVNCRAHPQQPAQPSQTWARLGFILGFISGVL